MPPATPEPPLADPHWTASPAASPAGEALLDEIERFVREMVERLPPDPAELARADRDPLAVFAEQGRALGFIRPSTRTAIRAPPIPPAALLPLPPGTVLARPPRHAPRKCGPRSATAQASVQEKLE